MFGNVEVRLEWSSAMHMSVSSDKNPESSDSLNKVMGAINLINCQNFCTAFHMFTCYLIYEEPQLKGWHKAQAYKPIPSQLTLHLKEIKCK